MYEHDVYGVEPLRPNVETTIIHLKMPNLRSRLFVCGSAHSCDLSGRHKRLPESERMEQLEVIETW